jgi:TetR/AcrR family transcriptional repressor of nem operon
MRGFNGFSYADIASALTLTKASLHYHFPTKAQLGKQLIERYEAGFLRALEEIERATPDARDRLRRYAKIYADVLRNDRMCLCGMLAAEYATLPKPMKEEMRHFFDENERWLSRVLEEGRTAGSLRFTGPALDVARAVVGSLEGAMMIARSYGEVARLETVADRLIAEL